MHQKHDTYMNILNIYVYIYIYIYIYIYLANKTNVETLFQEWLLDYDKIKSGYVWNIYMYYIYIYIYIYLTQTNNTSLCTNEKLNI